MTELEMEDKAIAATNNALSHLSPTSIQIRSRVKNFLDGALFFIYYKRDPDPKEYLIYAYVKSDDALVINSIDELAKVMSVYRPEKKKEIFSVAVISGIIALLVTLTICILVLYKGVDKPPEILSAALTAILGFYFGSQVAKKQE